MDKITDDIIGFVEEGIFESAKAYSVIKAFENYLEVSFNELLLELGEFFTITTPRVLIFYRCPF
jgi:hypothetical protein